MMNRIKYLCFYSDSQDKANRKHVLSAKNKIDYIVSCLKKNDVYTEIISPNWTENTKGFYLGKTKKLDAYSIKYFCTFGTRNDVMRFLRSLFHKILLFVFLFVNLKKDEIIIVYHSPFYFRIIKFLRKIKRFKLILEVEEIYQDVMPYSKNVMKSEYKSIAIADKYIFPTILLNEKLNLLKKPNIIIHGTYHVEEKRKCNFSDNKIHIVYAGTFDPRKGGALAAAAAAEYLSNRYHVHIIGFGTREQVELVKDTIKEVSKKNQANITYDGLLKGEEYIRFLQKCDIGLSTQLPGAAFNETSFPSKILSYMANGLRVVSVRIDAIEKSAVGNYVYYYEKQTPESIAKAINSIDFNKFYDGREQIRKLDVDFTRNLKKFLET